MIKQILHQRILIMIKIVIEMFRLHKIVFQKLISRLQQKKGI